MPLSLHSTRPITIGPAIACLLFKTCKRLSRRILGTPACTLPAAMKSNAPTVDAYMDSLPPSRRESLDAIRQVILRELGLVSSGKGAKSRRDFEECMQYGVVAYCVPHRVWPHGHHTRPELPLMYMGMSSQKNDMVVYMLFLFQNEPERAWFDAAWKAAGKKSCLEVTGAGCCLRFKNLEDLSLDVIARAIRRVPLKMYLTQHEAYLARIGKTPSRPQAKTARGHAASTAKTRKKSPAAATKKVAKRK